MHLKLRTTATKWKRKRNHWLVDIQNWTYFVYDDHRFIQNLLILLYTKHLRNTNNARSGPKLAFGNLDYVWPYWSQYYQSSRHTVSIILKKRNQEIKFPKTNTKAKQNILVTGETMEGVETCFLTWCSYCRQSILQHHMLYITWKSNPILEFFRK